MGEIKILVSEKLDGLIDKESERLGIKKTEFVKSLVIEYFKEARHDENQESN